MQTILIDASFILTSELACLRSRPNAWGCSNFVTGASGTSPTLTPYFQSGGQIAMSRAHPRQIQEAHGSVHTRHALSPAKFIFQIRGPGSSVGQLQSRQRLWKSGIPFASLRGERDYPQQPPDSAPHRSRNLRPTKRCFRQKLSLRHSHPCR